MPTFYLITAILGFIIPYFFLGQFMLSGAGLPQFFQQVTASPAARMLVADLVISSLVFWGFLFSEGRRLKMKNLWAYVVLNLLVGLSFALPLFLYFREKNRQHS